MAVFPFVPTLLSQQSITIQQKNKVAHFSSYLHTLQLLCELNSALFVAVDDLFVSPRIFTNGTR